MDDLPAFDGDFLAAEHVVLQTELGDLGTGAGVVDELGLFGVGGNSAHIA